MVVVENCVTGSGGGNNNDGAVTEGGGWTELELKCTIIQMCSRINGECKAIHIIIGVGCC